MKKIIVLILFIVLGFSQEENIVTDYPGQATGSSVIPKKRFQIETGASFNFSNPVLYNIPGLILRYGINKNVEVRYEGGNFLQTAGKPKIDNALGTKIILINKHSIQIALIHLFTESSFTDKFYFGTRTFFFMLFNLWKLSIYNNVGYSVVLSGEEKAFYVLGTSVSITNDFSLFGEIYNDVINGKYTTPNINGGLTYRIKKNMEVGLWSGYEITSKLNYAGLSVGIYPVRKEK